MHIVAVYILKHGVKLKLCNANVYKFLRYPAFTFCRSLHPMTKQCDASRAVSAHSRIWCKMQAVIELIESNDAVHHYA